MHILVLLAVMLVFWLLSNLMKSLKAIGRTASGRGSLKENFEFQFKGMSAFEIESQLVPANSEKLLSSFYRIRARGLIPVYGSQRVSFVTSIIDITTGKGMPVLSVTEEFQESNTLAYQFIQNGGVVSQNQGFVSWVQVGAIVPDILITPYQGKRKLLVILRVVANTGNESGFPAIVMGDVDKQSLIVFGEYTTQINLTSKNPGYVEQKEKQYQIDLHTTELAIAVAMVDGEFDEIEKISIENWIKKRVGSSSSGAAERFSRMAFERVHAAFDGELHNLSISESTEKINKIADLSQKHAAIDLCYQVMASDGTADPRELELVRKVSDALELNFNEVLKIKDRYMVKVDNVVTDADSIESAIGIDPDWPLSKKQQHIRAEFQKWNGRLTNLTDESERKVAQRMIELIADAKKKYG
jgi:tellurite resistance protein